MATLREQSMKHKGIVKKNQRPRCSITDPYEKFRPILNSENSKILIDEMEKSISKENGKLKVNWTTLKKLPLDVRKCQLKELANKHRLISPILKAQRLILKKGINEVSRCIEQNQIACCLIAEDVANSMIVKHLLYMTATKKIPVVILPDMRLVTKHILGFSAAALGLKIDVLNNTENSFHNLYQSITKLSNQFKNPYIKQVTREPRTSKYLKNLKIDTENYLLKKPREGKAFLPGRESTSIIRTTNDLSFIPIEKMIVEEHKPFKQIEELLEIPTSTNLFSFDTKPLHIEDIGESLEQSTSKTNSPRTSMRYYELKIKKLKPNINRKHEKEENTNIYKK